MNKRQRSITVIFSLWALFFAQAALASYACPGAAKAMQIAAMAEAGMPCAESMSAAMNDEQPALCHAHCQSSQQTAEGTQPAPSLPSSMALGAVLTTEPGGRPRWTGPAIQDSVLRPSASLPLALAHCCWRI